MLNKIKLAFFIIGVILIEIIISNTTLAHPGITASDGCHYCRTNCDKWGVPLNQRHCQGGSASLPPTTQNTKPSSSTTPVTEVKELCSNLDTCIAKASIVIDGDTIVLDTGEKVRYIGIDTPETVDPRKPVQCFGKEASNKNKELVEGKEIKLVKDVSDKDKYGRLLRYIYVGDEFVNDFLVKKGFAHSSSYPPDIKHQEQFRKSEEEAITNKQGLWADGICGSPVLIDENNQQEIVQPEENYDSQSNLDAQSSDNKAKSVDSEKQEKKH